MFRIRSHLSLFKLNNHKSFINHKSPQKVCLVIVTPKLSVTVSINPIILMNSTVQVDPQCVWLPFECGGVNPSLCPNCC